MSQKPGPEYLEAMAEGRRKAAESRARRQALANQLDENLLELTVNMSRSLADAAKRGEFDGRAVDSLSKMVDRVKGTTPGRGKAPIAETMEEDTDYAAALQAMPDEAPPKRVIEPAYEAPPRPPRDGLEGEEQAKAQPLDFSLDDFSTGENEDDDPLPF